MTHCQTLIISLCRVSVSTKHSCLSERTADPPLVLLDDLQQLHACSLDGVEDLQSRKKSPQSQTKTKCLFTVKVILS